ncbi:MAG: MgtC/SapB transporter [Bacteroidetes bacterium]|uniref:MgtC/SapB family protein n=1 Tax=Chitinophaga sp. LS1 TaxID=3051176 RepID=UPI001DBA6276|nr:MgtC/SapB family protein [Chitinophaga sp. LS1]MBP1652546.1 MgtC/SapB transporter [Bacteroidota bacterium]WPV64990.1 MgtC/SapB family protein [Chitinophaga sp. LS1]
MENVLFQLIELPTILKVVVSCVTGALLGMEREFHHKAAGMRTLTLICVGSTLFTILSVELGMPGSPDRVASNILTGVGFIGAGVIFKGTYSIDGITTAATIWIAAALGIGVGMGHYTLVTIALILVLIVLQGLKVIERRISKIRQKKMVSISFDVSQTKDLDFPSIFKRFNVIHSHLMVSRNQNIVENRFEIKGNPADMKEMSHYLQNNPDICQFEMQINPL